MKMSQLKAGDVVKMTEIGGRHVSTERFLGFTKADEKYSETPAFDTLKEVKDFYGVKNAKELDKVGNEKGYGYNVYACFECLRHSALAFAPSIEDGGNYTWQAYLYEGRWVLGSGCTRFSIEKV